MAEYEIVAQAAGSDLVPEISDLSRTLSEIEQRRKRSKVEAAARKAASEGFDSVYLGVGRVVEAMLRMAGREAEADRVHPSTRQLDRRVAESPNC